MNINDLLSTTRNEYTQKLKPKLNKYFSGNNINKIGNKSCNKKNKNNINNLYSVKKIVANSSMKGLRPNSSTKITNKYRGLIYRSSSGDN